MKKLKLLTALVCLTVMACQKNNNPQPGENNMGKGLSALSDKSKKPLITDVYVVGEYVVAPGVYSAAYWKNGNLVNLTPTSYGSQAEAIAVKDTDVYVVGEITDYQTQLNHAVYWKNGVMHPLNYGDSTTFSSLAADVAVEGKDVYIVGEYDNFAHTGSNQAILWKNGVAQSLSYNQFGSGARAVAVRKRQVYVAGYSATDNTVTDIATYWKNGVPHRLESSAGFSWAGSMTLSDTDVYIAGQTYPTVNGISTAVYWKNGIKTSLQYNATTSGIAVHNGNVYVGGTTTINAANLQYQATYWTNGTPTLLGSVGYYLGHDIQVAGNDIYLLANEPNGTVYYKNGVEVLIPNCNGSKILVVRHH